MVSTTTTADESGSNGGELSQEDIFEVLSNRRRRFVIHALKRTDGPLEISELSTHVTAWELDVEPADVTYDDRRNVYSTLQRTHLPKLEEKNVIHVDGTENLVRSTRELDELDIYVEALGSKEIPWSLYYVGLAGVAVSLLLAVATETPGFAALDPIEVAIFTATAFAVSAAVHHVVGRRARLGKTKEPPELRKVK